MARRYRPTADDPALRQAYLETYAARDGRKRLTRIHTELRIRQETVERWLRDPDFVAEVHAIDRRRLDAAFGIAATRWPQIVEEVAAIACGDPEEPTSLEGRTPAEARFIVAAYTARAVQRANQQIRAAELIARILGAIRPEPKVAVYAEKTEMFNRMPEDIDGLIAENERLDQILARAKARQAAEAERLARTGADGSGNGEGC